MNIVAGSLNLRILLVEDHLDTLAVQSKLLQMAGFNVIPADSYQAALRKAKTNAWDVLVTDLTLFDGSGWALLSALKAEHPNVPAIAISGHGYPEDIQRSKDAGFCVHLTKPITFQAMVAAVRECAAASGLDVAAAAAR